MSVDNKLWKYAEHLNDTLHEERVYPNVLQGDKVGYREDSSEDRLTKVAESEGITLIRNADGSHMAIDESHASEESHDER